MEFREVGCVHIPFAINSKLFSTHSDWKSYKFYWNRHTTHILALFLPYLDPMLKWPPFIYYLGSQHRRYSEAGRVFADDASGQRQQQRTSGEPSTWFPLGQLVESDVDCFDFFDFGGILESRHLFFQICLKPRADLTFISTVNFFK